MLAALLRAPAAADSGLTPADYGRILIEAYPEHLERIEGNELVWKDGTRMVLDEGRAASDREVLLERPDLKDQFHYAYPLGRAGLPPARDHDPGRIRHLPLFDKLYGTCRAGADAVRLSEIEWPGGERLKVSPVNGVAEKLAAAGRELAALGAQFAGFVRPSAGTYNCRVIAGTTRVSAHGHGIAVDINLEKSDYWRWAKPDANGLYPYRNRIPWEIVEVLERHGFIWGGKWYHYDTMHFEYRPELIIAARRAAERASPGAAAAPAPAPAAAQAKEPAR
jgi:hypothetical protein